ncbi:hypothetical protein ACH40D_45080 [Streptomyces olivaceoviridis]|nr:hypothetical protein [Streptomyces corchorusii]
MLDLWRLCHVASIVVAKAARTDKWDTVREALARWCARGHENRYAMQLMDWDRVLQETRWTAPDKEDDTSLITFMSILKFSQHLENLEDAERSQAVEELQSLLAQFQEFVPSENEVERERERRRQRAVGGLPHDLLSFKAWCRQGLTGRDPCGMPTA